MRILADPHNAARLHDVQIQPFRLGQDLVRFGAWVEPELVTTASRDFREQLHQHVRRDVNADLVRAFRDIANAAESPLSLHFGFVGVYRVNPVTLPQESADSLVAVFAAIVRGPDDCDCFHPVTIGLGARMRNVTGPTGATEMSARSPERRREGKGCRLVSALHLQEGYPAFRLRLAFQALVVRGTFAGGGVFFGPGSVERLLPMKA